MGVSRSLLEAGRRAVARLGYDVVSRQQHVPVGRRNQQGALQQLQRAGLTPATVIDVGAADGTPSLYHVFPGARHVMIEPLAEFAPALRNVARRLDDAVVVMAAAGDRDGGVLLHVHDDLYGSSLLNEMEGGEVDGRPRKVEQLTVDTICARFAANGPYLLKVDTQGSELMVLDGATAVLTQTAAIVMEVSMLGFFEGGPQFAQVVQAMAAKGFVVYDIVDPLYRPLDGALAQVDVVFVPDTSDLRRQHGYASALQRQQLTERSVRQARTGTGWRWSSSR